MRRPLLEQILHKASVIESVSYVGDRRSIRYCAGCIFVAHTDWDAIGYKAVAVNLSDLAAIGATHATSI